MWSEVVNRVVGIVNGTAAMIDVASADCDYCGMCDVFISELYLNSNQLSGTVLSTISTLTRATLLRYVVG